MVKQVNDVTCPKTGKQLEFRHLIAKPVTKKIWDSVMSAEVDRLIDTVTIKFVKRKRGIPIKEEAVYTRLVADLRPNKVVHKILRMCMGGDQMKSVMDTTTSTADKAPCKIHLNGVASTEGGRFAALDLNVFYLGTPFKDK